MESIRKIIREVAVKGMSNEHNLFAIIDTAEAEIEKIIKEEVKKASDAAYNFGVSIGVAQGRHEAANEERGRTAELKLQKEVAETSFARWERESKDGVALGGGWVADNW
jgi:hypothetical protein